MTISTENISIINKSSALVEREAENIATCMYKHMFEKHPEVKKYFHNAPSNQHNLLAETIAAYAVNILNIKMLMPAIKHIAKKHVAVGVQPEHYPIVESMLLLAIKEVLAEKASDELLAAWKEAIEYVSSLLIEMETEMYKEKNSH